MIKKGKRTVTILKLFIAFVILTLSMGNLCLTAKAAPKPYPETQQSDSEYQEDHTTGSEQPGAVSDDYRVDETMIKLALLFLSPIVLVIFVVILCRKFRKKSRK